MPPSTIHTSLVPSLAGHLQVYPGVRVDPLDPHDRAPEQNGPVRIELGAEGVVGDDGNAGRGNREQTGGEQAERDA